MRQRIGYSDDGYHCGYRNARTNAESSCNARTYAYGNTKSSCNSDSYTYTYTYTYTSSNAHICLQIGGLIR
jgi:hypothetical protein